MNTVPSLLLALLCLALNSAASTFIQLPQGDTYLPGSGGAATAEAPCGHLLPALQDYLYLLRMPDPRCGAEDSLFRQDAAFRRRVVLDLARRFPHEVNDRLRHADGTCHSPLSMAVQAQDAELVALLLGLGALPLSPQPGMELNELPPVPGVARKAEVEHRLQAARKALDLFWLAQQQQVGPRGTARTPQPAEKPADTLAALQTAHRNCYRGEPGFTPYVLNHAFRRLSSPRTTLLRVQPISRVVVQPQNMPKGEQDSSSVTTTARVVNAIKGRAPAQQTITWQVFNEGPTDAPEGSSEYPADAEPIFIDLGPGRFERAVAEGETLNFGEVDGDILNYGETWQAACDRVLADFPELAETTPATPDELAAARKVVEEAPILARATIRRCSVALDEEAGTATLTCDACLRDPLKGALIKGALRDWLNLRFSRSFPISEEWRRRSASDTRLSLPAILVLREEGGQRQVLQAFDGENDAALMRAINEIALCPWRVVKK